MKKGFRLCVSLLVIQVCIGFGYAQGTETEERELNEALVQYTRKILELGLSRGVDSSAIIKPSVDDDGAYLLNGARPIAHSKNISRQDLSSALKNYPDSTAVLFYSYLGDSLRVWLIDKDGVRAFHELETSRSELNVAMTNLRSSLRVDGLQVDKAPLSGN